MQRTWKKQFLGIVVIVVLVIAGPGVLAAQDKGPGPPPAGGPHGGGFEKDDVNHDDRVSSEEFSGPKEMFSRMDANGDGYITRDEIGPPPAGKPGGRPQSSETGAN